MQLPWYIAAGAGVIVVQMLAVFALLFECRRRTATERSLVKSMQQERKESEFVAHEVSRRLITAQENERKRIARDLHDDLNQRLAMLSVELELLRQKVHAQDAHVHVDEIEHRIKEMASDVHKLSFELHPAKLEQLGLMTAARTFCRDLSRQSGVQIHFASNDIPRDLDATLALCFYRVLQESLRNTVRHSGATVAQVELTARERELRLVISDSGQGFNPLHATRGGGLGFIGMRERMRQVNGTFAVNTSPGQGTRIEVCAPLVLAPTARN
jgi:signal transduction histidine kinase